jgi:hypothetical protein
MIHPNPKDIVLARAPYSLAHDRALYEFYDGTSFTKDLSSIVPVLRDMQHGQIFYADKFGLDEAYPFVFIGNNAQGDSKVQMGRAKELEGPWEVFALEGLELYALNKNEDKGAFDFRYCVYPHPWAVDTRFEEDMMITWSEGGMTGGVLAGMVRFECEPCTDPL